MQIIQAHPLSIFATDCSMCFYIDLIFLSVYLLIRSQLINPEPSPTTTKPSEQKPTEILKLDDPQRMWVKSFQVFWGDIRQTFSLNVRHAKFYNAKFYNAIKLQ